VYTVLNPRVVEVLCSALKDTEMNNKKPKEKEPQETEINLMVSNKHARNNTFNDKGINSSTTDKRSVDAKMIVELREDGEKEDKSMYWNNSKEAKLPHTVCSPKVEDVGMCWSRSTLSKGANVIVTAEFRVRTPQGATPMNVDMEFVSASVESLNYTTFGSCVFADKRQHKNEILRIPLSFAPAF